MKHKERQGNEPIPWHPAFVEAVQLELEEYRDFLEFHPEFQLTAEPLRIDCVVIKKTKDVVIRKNIAAIFREVNLLEYKSPGDYVSIGDFYKVYGYACLYASFEDVPMTSVTVSFVESRHPRELLNHLREIRRFTVEETSPGIYTVKGDILPIQIIDSRKLPAEENLWLSGLSDRLDPLSIIKISNEVIRQDKTARIQAYINAIVQANVRAIEEAKRMSNMTSELREMFIRTGWAAEWEAGAEERKAIDIAQNLINLGLPLGTITAATKLDPKKVEELYQQTANIPKT